MFGFGKKPEEGKNGGFVPAGGGSESYAENQSLAFARKEGSENYLVLWQDAAARILNKRCGVSLDVARLLADGFGQNRIFTGDEKDAINKAFLGQQELKDFSRETVSSFVRSLMLTHDVPDQITACFLDAGENDEGLGKKWDGESGKSVKEYLKTLE